MHKSYQNAPSFLCVSFYCYFICAYLCRNIFSPESLLHPIIVGFREVIEMFVGTGMCSVLQWGFFICSRYNISLIIALFLFLSPHLSLFSCFPLLSLSISIPFHLYLFNSPFASFPPRCISFFAFYRHFVYFYQYFFSLSFTNTHPKRWHRFAVFSPSVSLLSPPLPTIPFFFCLPNLVLFVFHLFASASHNRLIIGVSRLHWDPMYKFVVG